ncbi:WecB/TagA/CpsF family glycosyltransferase [Herminiimonas fonticola]|uniref:N-acetylglucosaminyldiphosphoundecaprenol N-acetyl-beta-D-mannosaminyltransferase n=1 Tax=Herminiimonas fonticola TaxID=303380 RepID=A0A4R6G505_9BURK|nr:WecB/TagA/CpsF family glycosyltransferase [Herminiimonas fonticola]RBA22999.1 glycosyltransferase, WecB/TagA/CpsF family [Herminiimonas fonticola]TDN89559.1 N-acetylglucosaminyldiphosphoundecaprenol N-acetyl-beta-D-mannosaminyltransferase [Herminiimonas fonticola]
MQTNYTWREPEAEIGAELEDVASNTSSKISTDFQRPVYCILGLPFDAIAMEQATVKIIDAARSRQRCFFSTPNLNFAVASLAGGEFRDSVIRSDLSVADGMPLIWIGKLLGLPIKERVAGSTLFEALRNRPGKVLLVYFFGGPDGVAKIAAGKLNATASGLVCVGYQSPGFASVEEMSSDAVIKDINDSKADFLVVALGAKKGQAWIEHNLTRLQVPVVSHLGAVVNFVAGTVKRAPTWVGRLGGEWLWRIKEEPALWKRYFNDGLTLLKLMALHVIPCAVAVRLHKRDSNAVANARVSLAVEGNNCTIIASGAWEESNLQSLREVFASATAAPFHIRLDFRDVTYIDSACIALLMLLFGHQSKISCAFSLCNVQPAVQRLLHLFCADYLNQSGNVEQHKSVRMAAMR